ncbi:MAG TPA: hypothetical protein PLO94_06665 [Chitinophagales bacterium]|nr:hypothetical protein [Chitinophagales bacterium]
MADYTQTITNTMSVFGMGPAYWNNIQWINFYWGDGNSFAKITGKQIDNSIGISGVVYNFEAARLINNSLILTQSNSVNRKSGIYNYIFPSNDEDGITQVETTYITSSVTASSYTSASRTSTTWSAL